MLSSAEQDIYWMQYAIQLAAKANTASSLMNQKAGDKKHFYHGQYMAFTEMYSMLEAIERIENNGD